MTVPVIAIDGPAGTGKSTTAREVARRLGWRYVDSGAFYRVAALLARREGLDLEREADRVRLRAAMADAVVQPEVTADAVRTRLDGEDVTAALRAPDVTRIVARVADDPALREIVNAGIRARVGKEPAVVDGRDIGSVVFPDALLKVYLDASLDERARRRAREVEPPGRAEEPDVLARYAESLADRDRADRTRAIGRLVATPGAVTIDTSGIGLDRQVETVVRLAVERGRKWLDPPPEAG